MKLHQCVELELTSLRLVIDHKGMSASLIAKKGGNKERTRTIMET